MRYHWRSLQGKDILQRVYPRRHPTFSLCVLGRSWSVLSTSFNQIGAFSLSLSPQPSLSHTHSLSWHEHTGNCFGPGLTLVSWSWVHRWRHTLMFTWTSVCFTLVCGSLFLLSTHTHSRIQWKHTWHYISLLYRGAFRSLNIYIF